VAKSPHAKSDQSFVDAISAWNEDTPAPIFRLAVQPSARSGLRAPCRMMVDKLTAVPRTRLGRLVGSLGSEDVKALNRAIFVFLGLSETEAP
jgi:mRNA interferase MazF